MAVAIVLALLPLGVSMGMFGGGSGDPLRVAFLPFQAPDEDPVLGRTATTVVETVHSRFRDEEDPRLFLIGPSVTARYRESTERPEVLGRQLGADVAVAGGIRRLPDGTARISAALVRVEDGRSLWTGEVDVADPADRERRRQVTEWLSDRVRRTLQTVRVPDRSMTTDRSERYVRIRWSHTTLLPARAQ